MKILKYPHTDLFVKCRDLTLEEITSYETMRAVDRMFNSMYESGGVGLAAPQVGWHVNLFIMNATGSADCHKQHGLLFINPRLTVEGTPVPSMEGCLSIPGVFASVPRPPIVSVDFTDITGKRHSRKYVNCFEAAIIQHEMDHCSGILFIDRLVDKAAVYPQLVQLKKKHLKGL